MTTTLMDRSFAALVLTLALGSAAHAQLVGLNHVWTVPGVINSAGFTTYVLCTNGSAANTTIGVEVYEATGAYTGGDSITVAPKSTVLFGTAAHPALSVDRNLALGTVSKGHARIVASSAKGVLCSAFLAVSDISATSSLTVAKNFSQKRD